MKTFRLIIALMACTFTLNASAQKKNAKAESTEMAKSGVMTPELLWSMGRIGGFSASPDGKQAVYSVTHYDIKENKGHTRLYLLDRTTGTTHILTQGTEAESNAVYAFGGKKIAFLSNASGSSQVWLMNADGSGRSQLTDEEGGVGEFLISPDGSKVLIIKEVETTSSIARNDDDLPKATGMVINDLMYKHWDTYVRSIPHPFLAQISEGKAGKSYDLLDGEPYECPMLPFGGVEQLAFSPDSRYVAYTCRKKVGKDYAISTDSDIFLYDTSDRSVRNLCKSEGYEAPAADSLCSLEKQSVNTQTRDENVGYDQNPQFSPDGQYIAWLSMERDGYESDRTRLCVCNLKTGEKRYVTEQFESGVDEFCWSRDSEEIYFTGVWHGCVNVHKTNLQGELTQLTHDVADMSLCGLSADGEELYVKKHSMQVPDEVFCLTLHPGSKENLRGAQKHPLVNTSQLTHVNAAIYDTLAIGEVKERWVKTTDGKDMLCWVIYPPHFDPVKKYPALLFCEGGPQSPVSQFWSYRWNFQIMAANGYVIIAPNRRGLPGFGMEWLEQISGDYTGQCMQDYLSAIDDIAKEPYIDAEHLGAVGASFGGFSVYWLAGNHNKRFKAFIAHDGIYNTQQQYVETEEMWFPNWDLKSAPWVKAADGQMQKAYRESPHLYVDKWDTPILCIHGQRDFRIEYTQAESAFNAARLRGLPAQLLLFPDENHWVLKPQNGILWQRTFFRWLDRWLKPKP